MTLSDVVKQIAFASQSRESPQDQKYSFFRLVRWAWHKGKNAPVKVFPRGF